MILVFWSLYNDLFISYSSFCLKVYFVSHESRHSILWLLTWIFFSNSACLHLNCVLHIPHILGEGNGTPLQYSCLENPMDSGAWWAAVHGVAKSQTQLSDFTFTFHFHALEKEKATHSSVIAWRIPGTGEPGRLPSVGSQRVRHDWSNLAAAAACLLHISG